MILLLEMVSSSRACGLAPATKCRRHFATAVVQMPDRSEPAFCWQRRKLPRRVRPVRTNHCRTTHDRTQSSLPVVGMSRCQRSFRRHTPMSLQARRQSSRPCAGHNLPWRDILPEKIPTRATDVLFEPIRAGALQLDNRIVMAPLTRSRAGPGLVPGSLAVEYYRQRASAGLIVSEATQVSAQAQGYADTPGCYTPAQVAGWHGVTDAVHANGGTIVVQLWHCGRVSHTSFQQDGGAPVGPSAIRARIKTRRSEQWRQRDSTDAFARRYSRNFRTRQWQLCRLLDATRAETGRNSRHHRRFPSRRHVRDRGRL